MRQKLHAKSLCAIFSVSYLAVNKQIKTTKSTKQWSSDREIELLGKNTF